MNRKFATVSFATKRSIRPSLLISQATTPHAFARDPAIPDSLLTSVNVPSPLLRKTQHGIGSYTRGMQYHRSLVLRLPQHLFFYISKSTKSHTTRAKRPPLSQSNQPALFP